jgi:hypothetical protein
MQLFRETKNSQLVKNVQCTKSEKRQFMYVHETKFTQDPEASFLNGFLRLRGELVPMQRWHSAELVPTRKLAPMLVLKNSPQKSRRRPKDENLL